ncbi:MAG: hypothetical protein ACREXY_20660 [Gammaproteobacteria bacterium]
MATELEYGEHLKQLGRHDRAEGAASLRRDQKGDLMRMSTHWERGHATFDLWIFTETDTPRQNDG